MLYHVAAVGGMTLGVACADSPVGVPTSAAPPVEAVVDSRPVAVTATGKPRPISEAEARELTESLRPVIARALSERPQPTLPSVEDQRRGAKVSLDRIEGAAAVFEQRSGYRVDTKFRDAIAAARRDAETTLAARIAWERAHPAEVQSIESKSTSGLTLDRTPRVNLEEAGAASIAAASQSSSFGGGIGLVWAYMRYRALLGVQNYTVTLQPNTPAMRYQQVSLSHRAAQYGSPLWYQDMNSVYQFDSPHPCGYDALFVISHAATNGQVFDPTKAGASNGDAARGTFSNNIGQLCTPPCKAGNPPPGTRPGGDDFSREPVAAGLAVPGAPRSNSVEDSCAPAGGGSGGGGASNPAPPSGGTGKTYCMYTDYYDGNGSYLYTVKEACWLMI